MVILLLIHRGFGICHFLILCLHEENMSKIPLKTKRGRGRPKSEDRLLIDSERAQFKLKSRIIEVSNEALETIYELMKDTKAPYQTRSGNARIVLELAAELHKELIASEAAQEEIEEVSPEENEDDQPKGIVVNFNGG
jgi:hypothetical protein